MVVAGLCAYEVAALSPWTRLPTLTELGRRHPAVKYALEAMLLHHWHLERSGVLVPGGLGLGALGLAGVGDSVGDDRHVGQIG